MIGFFRSFFQSKIGLAITFGFLALIAFAFASSDISGTGTFGGVGGDDNVATIGSVAIGTGELNRSVNNDFQRARQENPQLTLAAFVDGGGLQQTLQRLVQTYSLEAYGQSIGMVASKRLVDSEIITIGAFHGPDGKFSEQLFRQAMKQQGLSEQQVRIELSRGLLADQVIRPIGFGARASKTIVTPYAALTLEGRRGRIAFVPSALFASAKAPSEAALAAFYTKNRTKYMIPEQRAISYAIFSTAALAERAQPTEAELAALYKSKASEYAAKENRVLTQVILPTKAGAQALLDKIKSGTSLESAAGAIGLAANSPGLLDKAGFAELTSQAVADMAFAKGATGLVGPAQSGLGWHIVRIDRVESEAAKSLDQVRGLLTDEARQNKLQQLTADLAEKIENEFADGSTLEDVAKAQNLEIVKTPKLLATGKSISQPAFSLSPDLQKMLPAAFAMPEDSDPQLLEIEPGRRFAMIAVSDVFAAAPPPLTSVRTVVLADYQRETGSNKAKLLADKIVKQVNGGMPLEKALANAGVKLAPALPAGGTREQLARSEQRVPPPLALMFSMAQGNTKRLEAPQKQGWFIVRLDKIDRGDISKRPDLVATAQNDFGQLLGNEFSAQFINAAKADRKVKINDKAVKSVGDQLAGRNQPN